LNETARVVVADDEEPVRRVMIDRLRLSPGIEIVGEAGDGVEALLATQQHQPDVLLLDLKMPQLDGFIVLEHLEKLDLGTRVLVLSAHLDEEYLRRALVLGARGFVYKLDDLQALAAGVFLAARGNLYFSSSVGQHLLGASVGPESPDRAEQRVGSTPVEAQRSAAVGGLVGGAPLGGGDVPSSGRLGGDALTPRQRAVVALLAAHRSPKEIAAELGLSVDTVRKHIQHAKRRLGARSTTELVLRIAPSARVSPSSAQTSTG
jgi:DNA-binding NarL/FixJ family response regulator